MQNRIIFSWKNIRQKSHANRTKTKALHGKEISTRHVTVPKGAYAPTGSAGQTTFMSDDARYYLYFMSDQVKFGLAKQMQFEILNKTGHVGETYLEKEAVEQGSN